MGRFGRHPDSPIAKYWEAVMAAPLGAGNSPCIEYPGCIHRSGYGRCNKRMNGEAFTHRAAWVLRQGPIPSGLWVLHHCDNPACGNPAHLFLGTAADNTADMMRKGRGCAPVGIENGLARLTDDQVVEIIILYHSGRSTRSIATDYGVTNSYVSELGRGLKRRQAYEVAVRRLREAS